MMFKQGFFCFYFVKKLKNWSEYWNKCNSDILFKECWNNYKWSHISTRQSLNIPPTDITRLFLTAKPRFGNQDSSCWNCGNVTSGQILHRVLRFSKIIIAWDVTVSLRHTVRTSNPTRFSSANYHYTNAPQWSIITDTCTIRPLQASYCPAPLRQINKTSSNTN